MASSVWREQGTKNQQLGIRATQYCFFLDGFLVIELRKNALLFRLNMVQSRVSKLQGMMVDFDDITMIIV